MIKVFLYIILIGPILYGQNSREEKGVANRVSMTNPSIPSDTKSTKENASLYNYLLNIGKTGMLFGQHHATTEFQHTKDLAKSGSPLTLPIQSDVKTAVGDHPAVFGFDFSRGIRTYKTHVEEVYRLGGIITYSWHSSNPITNGDSKDKSGDPVTAILPGGKEHKKWLYQLDEIADYFNSLEVNGVKVPVIFRPFHENTGGWFWWGATNCTNLQYIELWRMTVDYLRKEKGVHNLLIAYSPSLSDNDTALVKAMYPGDGYVDIIGVDVYGKSEDLKSRIVNGCRFVTQWAHTLHKIPAITEVGIKKGIQNSKSNDWFMSEFLNLIKNDKTIEAAYMLTWKNTNLESYWVPMKGQPNYESFVQFYNDPYTLFLKELKNVYQYE